jgi:hypothetical protein
MCTHLAHYDRAIDYHQRAVDLKIELLGLNSMDTAISYAWLGVAHSQRGSYETAIHYHEKSLAIRKAESDLTGVATSQMHLARLSLIECTQAYCST